MAALWTTMESPERPASRLQRHSPAWSRAATFAQERHEPSHPTRIASLRAPAPSQVPRLARYAQPLCQVEEVTAIHTELARSVRPTAAVPLERLEHRAALKGPARARRSESATSGAALAGRARTANVEDEIEALWAEW